MNQMKKKLMFFGFLLIFIVLAMPIFLAQEDSSNDSTINNSTNEEIKVMDSIHGSYLRMLQLEYHAREKYFVSSLIIDFLDNKSYNVSELLNLHDEFGFLISEVEGFNFSDINFSVDKFIEIKSELRNITHEYKTTLADLNITNEDKSELRKLINEGKKDFRKDIKEKIKERRNELNKDRIDLFLERANINDSEFLDRIVKGKENSERIRERLKEYYKTLNNTKQNEVREKVRRNLSEKDSLIALRLKNFILKERILKLDLKNRLNKFISTHPDEIRERIKEKINNSKEKINRRGY